MSGPLSGSVVLVVEDEPLVALDIADCFRDAGATVVVARTLKEAMVEVERSDLTAAVLDHALHDGYTTSDICDKLKERHLPFIVYSGYSKLDGACAEGELVHKPASPQTLLATLKGVLTQHRKDVN